MSRRGKNLLPQIQNAPPSSARDWLKVFSLSATAFVLVTTEFLPIGMLAQMSASLGVPVGLAGLAVSAPGVCAAIAAPTLSGLVGHLDRRTVLLALTLMLVTSAILTAVAFDLPSLIFSRMLLGVAVGGFWAFSLSAARRLVVESDGGKALAIVSAGISIGTVVGVPAGASLGVWLGWQSVFGLVAVMGTILLAVLYLTLPSLPGASTVGLRALISVLRIRQIRVGFASTFLIFVGHFAAYTYLELYLREVAHAADSQITLALIIYGAAGALSALVTEQALRVTVVGTFAATSLLLGMSVLLCLSWGSSSLGALFALMLWGLAFGGVPICLQTWGYEAAPEIFEASSAVAVTVTQIALATGAFVGGRLLDLYCVQVAYAAGAIIVLTASLALCWCALSRMASCDVDALEAGDITRRMD